jgi:hypothetical protein
MVTRQRLRVGATSAGKIVTVHVEDTHFRVTCDGAEISLHPRTEQRPSPGGKPRSTPRSRERVKHLLSLSTKSYAGPIPAAAGGMLAAVQARRRCGEVGDERWG